MNKYTLLEKKNKIPIYYDFDKHCLCYKRISNSKSFLKLYFVMACWIIGIVVMLYYTERRIEPSIRGAVFTLLIIGTYAVAEKGYSREYVVFTLSLNELQNDIPSIIRSFCVQCIGFLLGVLLAIWGMLSFLKNGETNRFLLYICGVGLIYSVLDNRFYYNPRIIRKIKSGEIDLSGIGIRID